MNDDLCYITQEPQNITVTLHEGTFLGSVSVSEFLVSVGGETPRNCWYLNRLFVIQEQRSRGYGTQLLQRLKKACSMRRIIHKDWSQVDTLIVEPGGYDSDVERLIRFYKAKGFNESEDRTCLVLNLKNEV